MGEAPAQDRGGAGPERPQPGPRTAKGQAARLRSAHPLLKVTRSGRQPAAAVDRLAQDGVGPASSCEWSRVGALGIGLLA